MVLTMAVLAVAVTLAGCGRKGGLDLPPAAANDQSLVADRQPQVGPDGQVLPATHGPRRSSPLDVLID
jgi:predicted small lipoprotein YifL